MAKGKSKEEEQKIKELQDRELALFNAYNRRHTAAKKTEILQELIVVINKLEAKLETIT